MDFNCPIKADDLGGCNKVNISFAFLIVILSLLLVYESQGKSYS